MANQLPAVKNAAFTLYFTLMKNDGTVIANPGTITKKISKDGGAVADIAASVTAIDTTYGLCSLVLSATEMNADAVWIYLKDDTTGCVPYVLTIYTSGQTLDDVDTEVDSLVTRLTATRAGYLDQLEHIHDDTNGAYTAVTSGTYGNAALKSLIDTATGYIDTEVAAIKAKTDNLPTNTATAIAAIPTTDHTTAITAIKAKTDQLQFTGALVNASASVSLSQQNITDIAAGVAAQIGGSGSGDTAVSHDTGGTDALRVTTDAGVGVDNCVITAYLTSDYAAGVYTSRGSSLTGPDGRWLAPIYLDSGYTYTLTFYVQGLYQVTTAEVTP